MSDPTEGGRDVSVETHEVDLVGDEVAGNLARAALFAALIGAFAYVTFPNPFSPTSVTLQVLGVFLAGILLGPVWGAGSLVLYLVAGALGAPIFMGGTGGLGHLLLSQTSGYLWSFPIAAAVVGLFVHGGIELRDPGSVGVPRLVGAMVIGTAIVYALGVVGIMLALGLGPIDAFLGGAAAFIPAEAFKIAAAVGIVRSDSITAT